MIRKNEAGLHLIVKTALSEKEMGTVTTDVGLPCGSAVATQSR